MENFREFSVVPTRFSQYVDRFSKTFCEWHIKHVIQNCQNFQEMIFVISPLIIQGGQSLRHKEYSSQFAGHSYVNFLQLQVLPVFKDIRLSTTNTTYYIIDGASVYLVIVLRNDLHQIFYFRKSLNWPQVWPKNYHQGPRTLMIILLKIPWTCITWRFLSCGCHRTTIKTKYIAARNWLGYITTTKFHKEITSVYISWSYIACILVAIAPS